MERCNGVLKMRFRCLTKDAMFQPPKVSKIVGACAALHDFAIEKRLDFEEAIDPELLDHSDMHEVIRDRTVSNDGARVRNDIIRRIFS